MGFMEGLFGHPHEDNEATSVAASTEVSAPDPSMGASDVVASAPTQAVEASHMDMAASSPSTVDLSNMPVHPAEVSSSESGAEVPASDTTEVAVGNEDSEASSTDDKVAVPVSAGEFSTAVTPAEINDELPTIPTGEVSADTEKPDVASANVEVENADGASNTAEDQLAAWQKSDAIGHTAEGQEIVHENKNDISQEPILDTESPTQEAKTDQQSDLPTPTEAITDTSSSDKKDSFSPEGLTAEVIDEVSGIEARYNEMNGGVTNTELEVPAKVSGPIDADSTSTHGAAETEAATEATKEPTEIHAVGAEIPVEIPEHSDKEVSLESNSAVAIEDAPFPAPPVEVDAPKQPEVEENMLETDTEQTVGGADVHLDRAEYVIPEPSTETKVTQAEGTEVVSIAEQRQKLEIARKAIDEALQSLDKAA